MESIGREGFLVGMKAIAAYMEMSETTVRRLIKRVDFPAKKINGTWYTNKDEVLLWWRSRPYAAANDEEE